jgi:hypothetical protein
VQEGNELEPLDQHLMSKLQERSNINSFKYSQSETVGGQFDGWRVSERFKFEIVSTVDE